MLAVQLLVCEPPLVTIKPWSCLRLVLHLLLVELEGSFCIPLLSLRSLLCAVDDVSHHLTAYAGYLARLEWDW